MNFLEFILQNFLTSKKFVQMQVLRNSSILKYFLKNFTYVRILHCSWRTGIHFES